MSLSSQLAAASARLIALIGEFDAAEGWREWGMRSTADWLSWQTGVGLHAGREQVRVARTLPGLPLLAAGFAAGRLGRLSYSKVGALTRVATVESEAELVQMAEHATAAQIDTFVAGVRRARRGADVRARRRAAYVRWHQDDDGSIVGSFRLAPEQAASSVTGWMWQRGGLGSSPAREEVAESATVGPERTGADALVSATSWWCTPLAISSRSPTTRTTMARAWARS